MRGAFEKEWKENGMEGGEGHGEVGAPGIHQCKADLDVESWWLGRGPLH